MGSHDFIDLSKNRSKEVDTVTTSQFMNDPDAKDFTQYVKKSRK